MSIARRAFLKLAGVAGLAAASPAIALYREVPAVHPDLGPWVEDKGDFYIVRIPDRETFAGQYLDKPSIIMAGDSAVIDNLIVCGFVNLIVADRVLMTNTRIDARMMRTDVQRHALLVESKKSLGRHAQQVSLTGLHLYAPPSDIGVGIGFDSHPGEIAIGNHYNFAGRDTGGNRFL